MDAPIIKLNKFGDREVDWENGSKWSEFGKYNDQNQYQLFLKIPILKDLSAIFIILKVAVNARTW